MPGELLETPSYKDADHFYFGQNYELGAALPNDPQLRLGSRTEVTDFNNTVFQGRVAHLLSTADDFASLADFGGFADPQLRLDPGQERPYPLAIVAVTFETGKPDIVIPWKEKE